VHIIQRRLSKYFWIEALAYVCYLVTRLPSSVIGGKTPLEACSEKVAQDYYLLRVFGCPADCGKNRDIVKY